MANIKNSLDAVEMLNKIKTLRDTEGNSDRRNGLELAVAVLEDRDPEFEESESRPVVDDIIRERREAEIKEEDQTVSDESQKTGGTQKEEKKQETPKKADLSPKKATASKR